MRKVTRASPGPREHQDYVCKDLMRFGCLRDSNHLPPGMQNGWGLVSRINVFTLAFCGRGGAWATLVALSSHSGWQNVIGLWNNRESGKFGTVSSAETLLYKQGLLLLLPWCMFVELYWILSDGRGVRVLPRCFVFLAAQLLFPLLIPTSKFLSCSAPGKILQWKAKEKRRRHVHRIFQRKCHHVLVTVDKQLSFLYLMRILSCGSCIRVAILSDCVCGRVWCFGLVGGFLMILEVFHDWKSFTVL